MKKAQEFLKLLTELMPPIPRSSHALVWQDGVLRVALHPTSDQWLTFNIDETDFDKSVEQLVDEIVALIPERE